MANGEIDADLDNITPAKVLFLIQQILECIQNDKGEVPNCTLVDDKILLFEIDEHSYRIHIEDARIFSS
jgi:hypothetical protein